MLNDRNAKVLVRKDLYPDGANFPTYHTEYECACGKGRVIEERVAGFNDWWAKIKCRWCSRKYELEEGCGYIWAFKEKD